MATHHRAFTIIELIVVVTIIVVLLAILTPAMDRAIYRAELMMCATKQRGMASSTVKYAMNNKRFYPDRSVLAEPDSWGNFAHYTYPSIFVESDLNVDLRIMLADYFSNTFYLCPFAPVVSYEPGDTQPEGATSAFPVMAQSAYSLWYGYRYVDDKGMMRMGDRMDYTNAATGRKDRFNVLVSDYESIGPASTWGAHPDAETEMRPSPQQTLGPSSGNRHIWTLTSWYVAGQRKTVDKNFAFDDLSTQLMEQTTVNDSRLTPVGTAPQQKSADPNVRAELIPAFGK